MRLVATTPSSIGLLQPASSVSRILTLTSSHLRTNGDQPRLQQESVRVWSMLAEPDRENASPRLEEHVTARIPTFDERSSCECALLIGCVWEILLREQPGLRGDEALSRSKTRYSHHRASRRKSPREQKRLHREAMFQARKGRVKQAIQLLRKGMKMYPDNSFFPQSAGVLYLKQNNYKQGKHYLLQALRVEPKNSAALQALAGFYGKTGDPEQARCLYQEAVEADPCNAQALHAWAMLEKQENDNSRAIQLLEECLQRYPKHEPAIHSLAKIEIHHKHFVRARKLLHKALEINPSHAHSWTTLGELCYIQGDPPQARRVFKRMIKYCGADSILYASWANMESKMADNGKAMSLLQNSLDLDPSNEFAHLQMLKIVSCDPHFSSEAPGRFKKALQMFPENIYMLHMCASYLLERGQCETAEEIVVKLAHMVPKNGLVARTQGMVHIRKGERELAVQCFRRGMEDSDSEGSLLCHEELAKVAWMEGRKEVALDLCRHGAARFSHPGSRFLREWGQMERKAGNIHSARELLQQSVEVRAMDVRSWVALALLERSEGNTSKTLEILRQALSVAPKVMTLWYLYCDTATKALPLHKCRAVFQECRKCLQRCAQIYLLEATMEWKHGNFEEARTAFQNGSAHASNKEPYSPIFQAWAQFEEAQGNSEQAAGIIETCFAVERKEAVYSQVDEGKLSELTDFLSNYSVAKSTDVEIGKIAV